MTRADRDRRRADRFRRTCVHCVALPTSALVRFLKGLDDADLDDMDRTADVLFKAAMDSGQLTHPSDAIRRAVGRRPLGLVPGPEEKS